MDDMVNVPRVMVEDPQITPRAMRVYVYLLALDPTAFFDIEDAKTHTGMGEGTVRKALRELRTLGWVTRIERREPEYQQILGVHYLACKTPLHPYMRDFEVSIE